MMLAIALLPLTVPADEKLPVLMAGNTIYSNITVTTVSATDVYFTYSGGMGNVKIKDLSPDVRKHFNFDPKKAGKVEAQQAENKLKYHEQLLRQPVLRPPEDAPTAVAAGGPTVISGKKIWAKILLNQKAPDLVIEKWLTPEPDRRGKFVLIDFWATWCAPCRALIPELNGFQKKCGSRLVVVGISNEPEAVVARMTDPKIEYAVAIDTQARTKQAVEVAGIPHVLIIDPQGIVRWEGFPFLAGYQLDENVVADIIAKYSN